MSVALHGRFEICGVSASAHAQGDTATPGIHGPTGPQDIVPTQSVPFAVAHSRTAWPLCTSVWLPPQHHVRAGGVLAQRWPGRDSPFSQLPQAKNTQCPQPTLLLSWGHSPLYMCAHTDAYHATYHTASCACVSAGDAHRCTAPLLCARRRVSSALFGFGPENTHSAPRCSLPRHAHVLQTTVALKTKNERCPLPAAPQPLLCACGCFSLRTSHSAGTRPESGRVLHVFRRETHRPQKSVARYPPPPL